MISIVQGCTEFFLQHPSWQVYWESVLYRMVNHCRNRVAVETEILELGGGSGLVAC